MGRRFSAHPSSAVQCGETLRNLECASQVRTPERAVLSQDHGSVKENAQEALGSISVRNIATLLLNILFLIPGVHLEKNSCRTETCFSLFQECPVWEGMGGDGARPLRHVLLPSPPQTPLVLRLPEFSRPLLRQEGWGGNCSENPPDDFDTPPLTSTVSLATPSRK